MCCSLFFQQCISTNSWINDTKSATDCISSTSGQVSMLSRKHSWLLKPKKVNQKRISIRQVLWVWISQGWMRKITKMNFWQMKMECCLQKSSPTAVEPLFAHSRANGPLHPGIYPQNVSLIVCNEMRFIVLWIFHKQENGHCKLQWHLPESQQMCKVLTKQGTDWVVVGSILGLCQPNIPRHCKEQQIVWNCCWMSIQRTSIEEWQWNTENESKPAGLLQSVALPVISNVARLRKIEHLQNMSFKLALFIWFPFFAAQRLKRVLFASVLVCTYRTAQQLCQKQNMAKPATHLAQLMWW